MIEQLESRRLLSSGSFSYGANDVVVTDAGIPIPDVVDGVLRINGTNRNNDIHLSLINTITPQLGRMLGIITAAGEVTVYNGVSFPERLTDADGPFIKLKTPTGDFYIEFDNVRRIHVDAGAGDDRVEIDKSLSLKSTIIGARGNDTLIGGTQGDTLSGGLGDDMLFGGIGTAADRLDSGPGFDKIVATDRDAIFTTPGDDIVIQGVFRSFALANRVFVTNIADLRPGSFVIFN